MVEVTPADLAAWHDALARQHPRWHKPLLESMNNWGVPQAVHVRAYAMWLVEKERGLD